MLALKLGESLPSNNAAAIGSNAYSLQFTGTEYGSNDDFYRAFLSPNQTYRGSISIWTRISTMTTSGYIFRLVGDSANRMQLQYHASSKEIRFAYRGNNINKTVVFDATALENDGAWHHIFITYNFSVPEMKIYLDSVLEDTNTDTLGFISTLATSFDVGQNGSDANYYKGYLSEFSWFTEVIPVAQVTSENGDYPVDVSGMTSLVGYWRFNEGSGTTALGSGGYGSGYSLTLYNTPTWSTSTPTSP